MRKELNTLLLRLKSEFEKGIDVNDSLIRIEKTFKEYSSFIENYRSSPAKSLKTLIKEIRAKERESVIEYMHDSKRKVNASIKFLRTKFPCCTFRNMNHGNIIFYRINKPHTVEMNSNIIKMAKKLGVELTREPFLSKILHMKRIGETVAKNRNKASNKIEESINAILREHSIEKQKLGQIEKTRDAIIERMKKKEDDIAVLKQAFEIMQEQEKPNAGSSIF